MRKGRVKFVVKKNVRSYIVDTIRAFGVGVFGVYLENGKQSMLQPIHFWKDLFETFPKMYGL